MDEIIVNEYHLEHSCLTLAELRWILQYCRPGSAYFTYFLMRSIDGIRGGEFLDVQLAQFRDNYWTYSYRVHKPKHKHDRYGREQIWNKIRMVRLDSWERDMLLLYLEKHMVVQIQPDGSHLYLSPFNHKKKNEHTSAITMMHGMLWPWNDIAIINAYWSKLRNKAVHAGFDAKRLERSFTTRKNDRIMDDNTYIWRGHMLRHVAASLQFYKEKLDLKAVQKWICHTKHDTTWSYIHAAKELGATKEYLETASYANIFGYGEDAKHINPRCVIQTVLVCFNMVVPP